MASFGMSNGVCFHCFNGLVDAFDISYAPSLSVLSLTKQRDIAYGQSSHRKQLLAMGGAIYDPESNNGGSRGERRARSDAAQAITTLRQSDQDRDAAGKAFRLLNLRWENLPGTQREVEAVSEMFGPSESRLFVGRDASEIRLQQLNSSKELSNYRYLLFSAHGYISPEEPALNAVVLSQVEKAPGADDYVTVSEWPSPLKQ
jgi:CHAT domain-containing protein